MLSRSPFFWSCLFIAVLLSCTGESVYLREAGNGSILPPVIVTLIGRVRWLLWGIFVLDGFATSFSFKKITRYHGRFLIFYGILFIAALPLVGDLTNAAAFSEFIQFTGLFTIFMVLPLQIEEFIQRRGVDAILKLLFYNVLLLTFIGIVATLRTTGFTTRYTGWMHNPNQFIMFNLFFIVVVLANLKRKTLPLRLLLPTLLVLTYLQLLAGSRNGFAGLIIIASVSMIRSRIGTGQTIITSLLLGLVAWFFSKYGPFESFRILTLGTGAIEDTGRVSIWASLWPSIQEKWLFGWGVTGRELLSGGGHNIHNAYISLIIFFGVPFGILMGVWFVWACWAGLVSLFLQWDRENQLTDVAFLFAAYMVTISIMTAFEDAFILNVGSGFALQNVLAVGITNALTRFRNDFCLNSHYNLN